jgi:hypothetical protein
MTDTLPRGTLLIDEKEDLPKFLLLQKESNSSGWSTVANPRSGFDQEIQAAGWTLFFMAAELKATVFGFDRQKTLITACKRLIADAKTQHCNSIEITQVTDKSFLKMPYVSVSAHARHLQRGMVFSREG